MIFGLLTGSPDRLSRCTLGRSPFHQRECQRTHLNGPIRFPRHLFSVYDHGRQRSDWEPQHTFLTLRWPDCTLSRLRAEEYDRPVTQSTATPEPSSRTIPTLDRTLVARQNLECVATLGSRRSCPGWAAAHLTWILTVFTSLACSPRRTSRVGEDCRPRTTWRPLTLAGSPVLPPLRLTGGTTTRQDVASSFLHAWATPEKKKVFAYTQVRGPCESAAAC